MLVGTARVSGEGGQLGVSASEEGALDLIDDRVLARPETTASKILRANKTVDGVEVGGDALVDTGAGRTLIRWVIK